jgi:hypothetical protein
MLVYIYDVLTGIQLRLGYTYRLSWLFADVQIRQGIVFSKLGYLIIPAGSAD